KTKKRTHIPGKEEYDNMIANNMKIYFGIEKGFVLDIMFSQSKCESMSRKQKPFSDQEIKEIEEKIENKYIADYIILQSQHLEKKIQQKLEANKTKTGYVINDTPKTEGDKLFDAILQKYQGKVVFVDFWATWCGPCRRGMESIKSLKEELKGQDIEFVYITNHTSPESTWNMMIPDIKGEHYRVEKDEWNYFASKFNISGIPHYVLVDKDGTVVKDKVYFASSNEELRKLFNEYLVQ
ncbi:MAG: TlpA family protein disulfide reductase, partial [Bacteroidales bacterium]|nr:TlpA family protein disulfide reductase [Bacteroidales bacterium]